MPANTRGSGAVLAPGEKQRQLPASGPLEPLQSAGRRATAVGHRPTAIGYSPTAIGYSPTGIGYSPTGIG